MNLSAEDEHLNKYLRAQIYGGDPMAQYILEKALKNNRIAMVVVKTLVGWIINVFTTVA